MRNVFLLIALLLLLTEASGCTKDEQTGSGTPNAPSANQPADNGKGAPPASSEAEPPAAPPAAEPAVDPVQEQLDQMTLQEKVGQMVIAGVDGTQADKHAEEMIKADKVGGIIFYKNNLKDTASAVAFANRLKSWNADADNTMPLLLSVDQEGGRISRLPDLGKLPASQAIGNVDDEGYAADIGGILGDEVRAVGFNMDFAPVLDINSNPDNPVIGDRSFGANADIVKRMGIPVMKGIQGAGIIPVVKHFPGHGDTATDSHLALPVIHKGLKQLQKLEWIPFAEAIRQGADAVMVAHILFPEVDKTHPASMSKAVITGYLRESLQFDGVVMTDDLTMKAITDHFDIGQAAVDSILAGGDIVMVAHEYSQVHKVMDAIKKSVDKGTLTGERIDESVRRIIELKQKYKLKDEQTKVPDLTALNSRIKEADAKTAG